MIKKQFLSSSEALYNLGVAYLNKKRFDEAKYLLIKSNEIKKSTFTDFLIIITEIHPITQRRATIFTITETEQNILRNAYNKLTSPEIVKYFDKAVLELKSEYWHARISTLLFIDKEEALEQIEDLSVELKTTPDFKVLIADVLNFKYRKTKGLIAT